MLVSREAETDVNVRAALASEGCTITQQDRRVYYVRCGDSGAPQALNLATFDGLVQEVPSAEERRAQAHKFIHRVTRDTDLPETPALESLRLVIRPQNYVGASVERMSQHSEEPPLIVSFPLPGNLVALVAFDTPDSTIMVPKSTLAQWKVSEATAYSKALENLDAHPIPPKRFGSADTTLYGLESVDDDYEASRLLSPKSRASLEAVLGGHAVFAIPDRQHLIAAKADDARSVAELRGLTATHSQGPLRLTADLFEVDGAGKLRVVR